LIIINNYNFKNEKRRKIYNIKDSSYCRHCSFGLLFFFQLAVYNEKRIEALEENVTKIQEDINQIKIKLYNQ